MAKKGDIPANSNDGVEHRNLTQSSDAFHRELNADVGRPSDKTVAKADVGPETDEQRMARFAAGAEERYANLAGRISRMPPDAKEDVKRVITEMT